MKFTHSLAILFFAFVAHAHSATAQTEPQIIQTDSTSTKQLKIKKVDRTDLLAEPIGNLPKEQIRPKKEIKDIKKETKSSPKAKKVVEYKEQARKDSVVHKEKSANIHATFPGGDRAIMKFVRDNMRYPQECKSQRLTGRTEVALTIAPDGKITDMRLHKCSGNAYMDAEALRVAKNIPQWEPAINKESGKELEYIVVFVFRPGR